MNQRETGSDVTLSNTPSVVSHKQLELFFLIFRVFSDSWSSAARLDPLQGLFAVAEFRDYRFDSGGPNKGSRVGVPGLKEFIDRGLQVIDTNKNPAPNTFTS